MDNQLRCKCNKCKTIRETYVPAESDITIEFCYACKEHMWMTIIKLKLTTNQPQISK